eukprot:TRINITY_DN3864_c0_g1_i4.p1 TRINITY_DN3864_c0_g1~~TRINITY_DN3864_c0_g1_i4.p1  ORF type:complete len:972 (+),score=148.05 TRINITY_DN3864_c0_g1_i4:120-2918(+)
MTVLMLFSNTHALVTTHIRDQRTQHQSQLSKSGGSEVDAGLVSRLLSFPSNVKDLERRLLTLEKSIQDFNSDTDALFGKQSPSTEASASSGSRHGSGASSSSGSKSTLTSLWRDDKKCGKNAPLLPDGRKVECDPKGDMPCCSSIGWCGSTQSHCNCKGCINYASQSSQHAGDTNQPADTAHHADKKRQNLRSQSHINDGVEGIKHRAHHQSFPPAPPKDGHKGDTIVVIIPFRDRERHLVLFKKYWRWFAEKGTAVKKVHRWEVYVMEQFDSLTFNRGWNFNCGVAIASAQTTASPQITSAMGLDFDCAVIQDIDYLPERGVDYGECDVPIQLSSEIDRYNWKTPYLKSAGGIVGMSLKHWRKINGFGNNYFGWGGEDDELYHRLRLTGLLYGDCYPFCDSKSKDIGKPGISIKRPRRGFGRFSGAMMHSANHTKRITDSKAYDENIKQLQEIEKGGNRWKTDGLSNLAFNIVDHNVDTTDTEKHGITYHHVRVHRGMSPFDLRAIPLAVPPGFCDSGSRPADWQLQTVGKGSIPWDLPALRNRAAFVGGDGDDCPGAQSASFLLIDRRRMLAKVFSAESDPNLLVVFMRSMQDPEKDGIIVADGRSPGDVQKNFVEASAFADPPADYTVCTASLKKEGPKYSIHQGTFCSGGGWEKVSGGDWQAYAKPRPGFQAITFCDNEKHWTQRIVQGPTCPEKWAGLKWVSGGTFYVPRGNDFCVGSRQKGNEELSFSRLLAKRDCGGDGGFRHDFGFNTAAHVASHASIGICIGRHESTKATRVSTRSDCNEGSFKELGRFAARSADKAAEGDKIFCVKSDDDAGDIIRDEGKCGADKFSFAVPAGSPPTAKVGEGHLEQRSEVCVGFIEYVEHPVVGIGSECSRMQRVSLKLNVPSVLDIVTSTPQAGSSRPPLYTIVEEAVGCFGFLCPTVLL